MEVSEALRRRRMCRDFRADPLPDALIDDVVGAAAAAPSAGNARAVDFVVLASRSSVGAYWDLTLPDGPRRAAFRWQGLLAAPVLVLPYVDPGRYLARYAEDDKAATGLGEGQDRWPVPYWWVDGGAAVMAVLLAATSHGLGSLFFGQFDHEPAVADLVGVPRDRRSLGTIALGRPAEGGVPGRSATRGRRPRSELIHRERWGDVAG